MFDLIISTLTQGFIYALLSYGIYITYKILDFPDLTVDGSFPLGAAITAVLLVKGMNPFLVLVAALLVGAAAGHRCHSCEIRCQRPSGRHHHYDGVVLHQFADCRLQSGGRACHRYDLYLRPDYGCDGQFYPDDA